MVLSSFSRQAKLRLEMEMERLRQTHAKEVESRDEEVEEIRQSCQKKVRRVLGHGVPPRDWLRALARARVFRTFAFWCGER